MQHWLGLFLCNSTFNQLSAALLKERISGGRSKVAGRPAVTTADTRERWTPMCWSGRFTWGVIATDRSTQ